jgi:hypothetical protein
VIITIMDWDDYQDAVQQEEEEKLVRKEFL